MPRIAPAIANVVAALKAGDVRAAADPADVNTPGVWVTFTRLVDPVLSGGGLVRVQLVLCADDGDHVRAVEQLDDLYDQVLAVIDPMSDVTATTVVLPGDSTPRPALTFTHDV